ncbi:MAG: metallophosphoesterase [Thermoanaerobaculia bacterium]
MIGVPRSNMLTRTSLGLGLLAFGLFAAATTALATPGWQWHGVPRVVALGDLHGSADKAIRLLTGAGLVDPNLHWIGGGDHLVVAGDFIDRGSGDRLVMDLLRRLQTESEAAGGRVHVLLGNHEVMNLLRDTRDVNPGSYRSFADRRDSEARKAAWRSFSGTSLGGSPRATLSRFNRYFPRGFFERQASFDLGGEYGDWLLELPVIVKINGVVYLHGGLSEEFAALGLPGINRQVTAQLRLHLESRRRLAAEAAVTPAMRFLEIGEAANRVLEKATGASSEVRAAAESLIASADSPILRSRGPLWYRGNSFEDERIEQHTVERSLELVEAKAMVVAHSPTRDGKITSRFHGQLFRIDHGIGKSERPLALVVERGEVLVLDPSNGNTMAPATELPSGTHHRAVAFGISDEELSEFLETGTVVESRDLGRGSTRPRLIVVERDGQRRRAVFKTVEQKSAASTDRHQHEVAAYRLDRRLGLKIVPVTVMRRIDERLGSLQAWIERAIDRETSEAYRLGLFESESAKRQLVLGELFDALIGNRDRTPSDLLQPLNGDRIRFIDHSKAFTTSHRLDWEIDDSTAVSAELVLRLRKLDREFAESDLGELLSREQIDALLSRRDQILARLESAAER